MELKFERDITVDVPADVIRTRLMRWSSENGYVCASDVRDEWRFIRGSEVASLVTTDIRKIPTEATISMGPTAGLARIRLCASSPLVIQTGSDAKVLESEIESLVSAIRTEPRLVPPPLTHAARKPTSGGFVNAVKRGAKGMRDGYVEAKQDREKEEGRKSSTGSKAGTMAVFLGLLLLVGVLGVVFAPQLFRVRGVQAPVNVSLRGGFLTANVVQVQNLSRDHIANVIVTASRPSTGATEARRLGTLAPGQVFELGGLEWNWVVYNGDTVSVKADGFLPVVFSSNQMTGR